VTNHDESDHTGHVSSPPSPLTIPAKGQDLPHGWRLRQPHIPRWPQVKGQSFEFPRPVTDLPTLSWSSSPGATRARFPRSAVAYLSVGTSIFQKHNLKSLNITSGKLGQTLFICLSVGLSKSVHPHLHHLHLPVCAVSTCIYIYIHTNTCMLHMLLDLCI